MHWFFEFQRVLQSVVCGKEIFFNAFVVIVVVALKLAPSLG